jgi:hypothetical protein
VGGFRPPVTPGEQWKRGRGIGSLKPYYRSARSGYEVSDMSDRPSDTPNETVVRIKEKYARIKEKSVHIKEKYWKA